MDPKNTTVKPEFTQEEAGNLLQELVKINVGVQFYAFVQEKFTEGGLIKENLQVDETPNASAEEK